MLPVPMGTENLLGRYVGQSTEPAAVCRTLDDGVVVGLDLGQRQRQAFSADDQCRIRCRSRSLAARKSPRKHHARAYFLPTLRTIRSYGYPQMQLYSDDAAAAGVEPHDVPLVVWIQLAAVRIGPADRAGRVATDGLLDVCTFERGTVWSVLRYLWHVVRRAASELAGHRDVAQPAISIGSRPTRRTSRINWTATTAARCRWTSKCCPASCGCWFRPKRPVGLGFAMPTLMTPGRIS